MMDKSISAIKTRKVQNTILILIFYYKNIYVCVYKPI